MTIDPHCGICSNSEESTSHILRNCIQASEVWMALSPHLHNSLKEHLQGSSPLQTWLHRNLTAKTTLFINIPWSVIFAFSCWLLWKNRNRRQIKGESTLAPSLHCIHSMTT